MFGMYDRLYPVTSYEYFIFTEDRRRFGRTQINLACRSLSLSLQKNSGDMKNSMKITSGDYIRANREAARKEELAAHLRPVSYRSVHKSKKLYDRKKNKADLNKDLPYLFSGDRECNGIKLIGIIV